MLHLVNEIKNLCISKYDKETTINVYRHTQTNKETNNQINKETKRQRDKETKR